MTGWLSLTDEQRRTTLEQASVRSGILAKAIEKDWWVTLCLKALFSTEYAPYCIFKGGTSLSKGWKLIQRFSEDIDIALDPKAFDMEYIPLPTHGYVKKLKRKGCEFTSTLMKDALEGSLQALGLGTEIVTIVADDVPPTLPDKDPQTLFIRYRSLFDPHPYLADEVKRDFGVRSLKEPFATISIRSILFEEFPSDAWEEAPFDVVAVEPRKTLLEKTFLLHEKLLQRYPHSLPDERQSRHLYDIVQLMDTTAGTAVLADEGFYSVLQEHRRHYMRLSGVDYDTLSFRTINFIPDIGVMEDFKKDYEQMQQSMIYVDSHDFEELIRRLTLFNGRMRLMGTGLILEDVIAAAFEQNEAIVNNESITIMKMPVELITSTGTNLKFLVIMHRFRPIRFYSISVIT